MKRTIFITAFVFFFLNTFAQQTEIQYLSGTGLNSEKIWKFRCSPTQPNASRQPLDLICAFATLHTN